jgi:hypothetical protein
MRRLTLKQRQKAFQEQLRREAREERDKEAKETATATVSIASTRLLTPYQRWKLTSKLDDEPSPERLELMFPELKQRGEEERKVDGPTTPGFEHLRLEDVFKRSFAKMPPKRKTMREIWIEQEKANLKPGGTPPEGLCNSSSSSSSSPPTTTTPTLEDIGKLLGDESTDVAS